MSSAAAKKGFDPSMNGISAYRYTLVSALLQCEDAVPTDNVYRPHVTRLRALASPSVNRHRAMWQLLRDGHFEGEPTKKACGHCGGRGYELQDPKWIPGFWVDEENQPLQPGELVPKEAFIGMEGAVMQILHRDGLMWVQKRERRDLKDRYREAAGGGEEE